MAKFTYDNIEELEEVIELVKAAEEMFARQIVLERYEAKLKNALGAVQSTDWRWRVVVEIEEDEEEKED